MKKNNILLDGIIASMGIFFAKVITLLYISPYYSLLETAENIGFYANVYNIYAYILNIATVGLPFAIATLTAKYLTKKDYASCLKLKRISLLLMSFAGFIAMTSLMILSKIIAFQLTSASENIEIMQKLLLIISPALFIIPILSSERGFYQGIKRVDIYSKSQVIEQFSRIIFLLTLSYLFVRILKLDSIWALYFGVVSTSFSGIFAIFYIKAKGKSSLKKIQQESTLQKKETFADKYYLKELAVLAFPYLLISIFGYSDAMINQFDFVPGFENFGITSKDMIELYREAIFAKASKLIAIPMILGQGLAISIIPHITEALTNADYHKISKNIYDCITTVLYITIPLCICLALFAKPILFILFNDANERLNINTYVLQIFTIEAFFTAVSSVMTSIMMATGKRRKIITYTIFFAIIKVSLNRLMISYFGVLGMILSSLIAFVVIIFLNSYCLIQSYALNFKQLTKNLLIILLASAVMLLVYTAFHSFITFKSPLLSLITLICIGSICLLSYILITWKFHLPQKLFKNK